MYLFSGIIHVIAVIRRVLCVRILPKVILLENYKYWFLSFGFYINWKNLKWRLSTYIWLKLKFSIIEEIVRIRLVFMSKQLYSPRIHEWSYFVLLLVLWFTGSHQASCILFCFATSHMIYGSTSGKVHTRWQIISSYHHLLVNFK